jgi:hypothetical protein
LPRIVDQEEFQLHRANRRQAARLVAFHHGAQRMAGIALIGFGRFRETSRSAAARSALSSQGIGMKPRSVGFKNAILIALFKDQRAVIDIFAPDVEVQHRKGEACRRPLRHFFGETGRDALAARLPVQDLLRPHEWCAPRGAF